MIQGPLWESLYIYHQVCVRVCVCVEITHLIVFHIQTPEDHLKQSDFKIEEVI